jgi:predicted amidohydrolase
MVSLAQDWENKDRNLASCLDLVKKAKQWESEIIIFPEMTLTGFSMKMNYTTEIFENSITLRAFQEISRNFSVAIIFGIVFKNKIKATNSAIMVDDKGLVLGRYDKIHPFSFSGEHNYFESGDRLFDTQYHGMAIGITICYDLRFPEIYSALGKKCNLIINIANWPIQRIDHWNTLLKARAIESQIFIAGINRIGLDGNGNEYPKSSILFDPNGSPLKPIYSEAEIDIYEVDLSFVDDFRRSFSTTQDRKVDFYKTIL